MHVEQLTDGASPALSHLQCHELAVAPLYKWDFVGTGKEEALGEPRIHQGIGAEGLAKQFWLYAAVDAHGWIINQFGLL